MSRLVAFAAIQGAYNIVQKAEGKLKEAVEKFGPEQKLEFPDTAYYLPIIYSLLGAKIEKLADAEPVMERCSPIASSPHEGEDSCALSGPYPGCRDGSHSGGGDSRGDPLC